MDKKKVLQRLPKYIGKSIEIHPDQEVKDIVREVLDAHAEFADHYDRFALLFDGETIDEICNKLYTFCKKEIRYKEETSDNQTSGLPSHILTKGIGDCKHYALFIAGCLDAIRRLTGKNFGLYYRFASYDPLEQTPHHVFVVVKDNGEEMWIDPTPGADNKVPFYYIDKKVKNNSMALRRYIAGFNSVGFIDPATIMTATSFITDIASKLGIGDQVPGYPIKSRKTFEGMIATFKQNFPTDPQTVEDAQRQLQRTNELISTWDWNGTGAAAQSYKIMWENYAKELQKFIAAGGKTSITNPDGSTNTSGDSAVPYSAVPYTGANESDPKYLLAHIFTSPLFLIALLGVGGYFLFRKKRSVRGSNTNWLLIGGAGIGLLWIINRSKKNQQEQQQKLLNSNTVDTTLDPVTNTYSQIADNEINILSY